MKLSYVRLLVNDFDSCFEFYSKKMKLKVTWGKPGDVYASFETGSFTALSIFAKDLMLNSIGKEDKEVEFSAQQVICFESNDVDNDYNNLKSIGVKFLNEPTDIPDWGIRCVHLTDPEGNIVEINQELPKDKWSEDLLSELPDNK